MLNPFKLKYNFKVLVLTGAMTTKEKNIPLIFPLCHFTYYMDDKTPL